MRRYGLKRYGFVVALAIAVATTGAACEEDTDATTDPGSTPDVVVDIATDGGADAGQDAGPSVPFDFCTLGEAPDDACFAEKRDPLSARVELAKAIADKQLEKHTPESLGWDWGEAVMLLGIEQLYRVTGEVKYRDYYKAYIDHHLVDGYNIETSDTCAPAALAIALYGELGDAKYRALAEEALHYLYEEALRTEEGGINHMGTLEFFGVSLWVDSLFMFGNVLIGWAEQEGDAKALDELGEQFDIFAALLQEEPGWFKHAYDWAMPQTDGIYWARGNAWVTAAGYDYLRARLLRGESDEGVQTVVDKQAAAALATQDTTTGLWWNIVNRPDEIYLETSASALFAFALARAYRYGFQDASVLPVIEAAMAGVEGKITQDGQGRPIVTGTSGPTTAGAFEDYAAIALEDDISYGLGAVLFALTETSGLPGNP